MENKKDIKTLMEEMKKSLIEMDVHSVLDYWYDLKDELENKGLM
ncbi:hypothetical protein [Clostridium sp.]